METTVKYPDITIQLTGEDGNIFYILGRVRKLMKQHGILDQFRQFQDEVYESDNYNQALQVVMTWFNVE